MPTLHLPSVHQWFLSISCRCWGHRGKQDLPILMELPFSRRFPLGAYVSCAAVCGRSWDGSWPLASASPSSHVTWPILHCKLSPCYNTPETLPPGPMHLKIPLPGVPMVPRLTCLESLFKCHLLVRPSQSLPPPAPSCHDPSYPTLFSITF